MLIKKKINIPLYNQFTLTIVISDSITEDIVRMTKQDTDVLFTGVFCFKEGGLDLLMGFDKDKLKPGLVSHECLHATCYIMDYVGIPLTEHSEEAYTYLLSYLVDEVYKVIDKI